jgi:CCR4-NOT transcription complex subunit 4
VLAFLILNHSPGNIPSKILKTDCEWLRLKRPTRRKVWYSCYAPSLLVNSIYKGLPRTAGWAKNATSTTTSSRQGPAKRVATTRPQRTTTPSSADVRITVRPERKTNAARSPSQPSSRPQTPSLPATTARPTTPSIRAKPKDVVSSLPSTVQSMGSPALSSLAVDSDAGSVPQEASSDSPALRPQPARAEQPVLPPAPPGIPPPPGLLAPPGLPPPTWAQTTDSTLLQTSYQMSSQAQALIDDLRARREAPAPASAISPFPDIDRTLQVLTGGNDEYGGFSFNLDPKLAEAGTSAQMEFPDLDAEAGMPFQGSFLEAFPGLSNPASPAVGFASPPGLNYTHSSARSIYDAAAARPPPQPDVTSGYMGSFNPFDSKEEQSQRQHSPFDDDSTRKVSRFGFARGKQNSAATSPLPPTASLQNDMITHPPYYDSPDFSTMNSVSNQWNISRRQTGDYLSPQSRSVSNSPAVRQAQVVSPYPQQQLSQFQPFDSDISEAQLRDFINSSRDRVTVSQVHSGEKYSLLGGVLAHRSRISGPGSQWDSSFPNSPFTDPAIMSASMSSNHMDPSVQMSMQQLGSYASNSGFGPPPGLTPPTQLRVGPNPTHSHTNVSMFQKDAVQTSGSAHGEYLFALQGEGAPRTPYRAPYLPQRGDSINNREPYYRAKAF